jgi:hypothetical protein
MDFVHYVREAYDDLVNESCLMADGPMVLHEPFLSIFMLMGMSEAGPFGNAK